MKRTTTNKIIEWLMVIITFGIIFLVATAIGGILDPGGDIFPIR